MSKFFTESPSSKTLTTVSGRSVFEFFKVSRCGRKVTQAGHQGAKNSTSTFSFSRITLKKALQGANDKSGPILSLFTIDFPASAPN